MPWLGYDARGTGVKTVPFLSTAILRYRSGMAPSEHWYQFAFAALLVGLVAVLPLQAFAHGGGLDGLGCHQNRKAGGYHCHRGPLAGQHFSAKPEALKKLQLPSRQEAPSAPPSDQLGELTGKPSITDGDTIRMGKTRIRLHGIDAPESKQSCRDGEGKKWACGREATFRLANLIGKNWVTCEPKDLDRYKRVVAVCFVGGKDINALMVRDGWALAYRQYSKDYVSDENTAKEAGLGLWRGEFTPPWEWRRGKRLAGSAADRPKNACPIKGNISRKGAHIYHVPGGQYYTRTRIDTGKGERWFCSEAEAREAGWRRAGR